MQKFSSKILPASFFNQPTLYVAQKLLGKFLVRRIPPGKSGLGGGKTIAGMIAEVEAYVGPEDRASHASRGKTERTKVMFGKPGQWYVYMIYGMYYCLNIVTEKKGYPAAVLIRSVHPVINNLNKFPRSWEFVNDCVAGPGRVCRYFKIDKSFNAKPANKKTGLWIENRGVRIASKKVKQGKRLGVDYAGKWRHKPWRFFIKGCVSRNY